MRGFAYPNATNTMFLGCGHYRVSAEGKQDDENVAFPNMGNLATVVEAARFFAPELTQNRVHIYESKDKPKERYSGNSMGLAYFLALLHQVWRVRKPFQDLAGPIWCTGAIDKQEGFPPKLEAVESNPFAIKLLGFLTTEHPGAHPPPRLFLVPATNLTVVKHWCQTPQQAQQDLGSEKWNELRGVNEPFEPATMLDVSTFGSRLRTVSTAVFSQKTVVVLEAHDLRQLVDILFERPTDPDITQWFDSLTTLRKQGQITDERYWEVLEHVVGPSVPRSISHEELLDALATHRERLYLKSTTTAEPLSKIPLREVRTTRVHQVLVALRYALPVIQTVLGLRFVLIPPGTVYDIVMTTPYYLAETSISGADWTRILGSSQGIAQSDTRAAVDITPLEIERFVARANAQVDATRRLVVPSERQWRFAVEAAGPLEPPPRGTLAGPILKTTLPSALGLYDVLGIVYQLCQQGRGRYAWYGGSYRTPASDFSPMPVPIPVTTPAFAKNPEWGFRPVLTSLEDQRWA